MSKLELYEATLQKIALSGTDSSTLATSILEIASKQTEPKRPDIEQIVAHIQAAIRNCNEAIRTNGDNWANVTDDSCREAIDNLSSALAYLPAL